MSEYIPFEIQIEIINRLPAKSFVQFRLVSKPWNAYIGSSEFIIARRHRNIRHQPQHLLALYKDPYVSRDRYIMVLDDGTFYQQDFTPKAPSLTTPVDHYELVGCSLGLVCFFGYFRHPYTRSYGSKMAILWNPLIRKTVQVVLPYFPKTTTVGFGVCPVTFDPTVVKILHYLSPAWEVEVFTLSTGTWKTLVSSNLPCKRLHLLFSYDQCSQVVIDRFIYWLAIDATDRQPPPDVILIVSFDMTTHKFEAIDLPESLSRVPEFPMTLSKIRESAVVVKYIRAMEDVCDVWVMEDIVTKSFAKLYTIKAQNPLSKTVVGFRGNGEPIMETRGRMGKNYLRTWIKAGIYRSFFVSSYIETLLLLDQADCLIDTT